jgi:metal-responsive CopG/Arc/MetJ family transcriptional regulator
MKRISLNFPEELHTRFKVVCTLEGTDMTQVLQELVREYVEKAEKRKLIVYPKSKK